MLHGKFKRLFFLAIVGSFFPCRSFSQTTQNTFFSSHFCLQFSDSGTYTMRPYFGNMPTLGYKSQDTISFGYYKKQGDYYILEADKSIIENQGECTDFSVQYGRFLGSDSLFVFINSPYEEEITHSNLVKVYLYLLTLHCTDGSVISIIDSTNRIPIFLNGSQHISKMDVLISYRPDFYSISDAYSFTHSPYCHISLKNIPINSNMVTIFMPNFRYFSLTYLPYRNYRVQILDKHTIIANGELFYKYDLKYKIGLNRWDRKLRRHPQL